MITKLLQLLLMEMILLEEYILVKFRTTHESYFNNAMTNSDWYKNYVFNNNTSSLERPQVYIYTSLISYC